MLSIIVPVFNAEMYLNECISSIVNQTVTDLEIILVDDGSTDTSGSLCDAWAEKDSRIKVYHKSNGGLMSAWKYGAIKASGVYIGFVDSDDWVDANMYEKMLALAMETGVDMVCASYVCEYTDGRRAYGTDNLEPGFYDRNRILTEISPYLLISKKYHERAIVPSRATKIFRRELLLTLFDHFDENITIGEDLVATFSYLQIAESIFVMGGFWPYHYRINSTSMIQSFFDTKYEKIDLLRKTLLAVNEKYDCYDYSTQIYTDYLALFFRTVENQILSAADGNLIMNLRKSFSAGSVKEAISMSDSSMLTKKHRLYLCLMRLGLFRAVVWIRRMKN